MEGQITADKSYSKGNSNSISSKKKFTVRVVKYGSGEVGGGNNRSCGLSVLDQSQFMQPQGSKATHSHSSCEVEGSSKIGPASGKSLDHTSAEIPSNPNDLFFDYNMYYVVPAN